MAAPIWVAIISCGRNGRPILPPDLGQNFMKDNMSSAGNPIITGMSLRVPGARDAVGAWRILRDGNCTVGTVSERWFNPARYLDPHRTRRGRAYSLAAGQLAQLYHFDAGFFGISPREAEQMDPQQRLMLQSVWEAIEDSGLQPRDLSGERTGVYVGSSIVENLSLYYFDPARAGSSFTLGNTLCIIANRVSSVFDFRGPSLVLDAACSSGLYAFHLAVEALMREEIDTAIVGAVHVTCSPGGYIGFSQARMVSPTGLCRAFDAQADGYVRSEASVALVLQRAQVAQRMGARRRARVLASGINTDGNTSLLTVPSSVMQERLIDKVLLSSGIDPDDLSFYEAHGTGTPVGDPAEAASLGGAIGQLRRNPLPIGSSKTNFGHAEPAAGLVGMAKVLLAFEHRQLPASLHFETPNPAIDFEALNLTVNAHHTTLSESGALVAGINSFGFGGTNASAMIALEQNAPSSFVVHRLPPAAEPWLMISAASPAALKALAAGWSKALAPLSPLQRRDMVAAAGRRPALAERMALPFDAEMVDRLGAFAQDAMLAGAAAVAAPMVARVRLDRPKAVFACAGNGTQTVGMGLTERNISPVFRQVFDATAQIFVASGGPDIGMLISSPDLGTRLASPLVAQPILFAYQVALAAALQEAGLRAEAVIGHSVGEIAALHLAGYLSLADAAQVILSRSRAFETLRGTGGMVAIAASEAEVIQALNGLDAPELAIAAINSPRSVSVAGPEADLARLARVRVGDKRLAMVRIKVEIPFHAPAVEALRARFYADVSGVTYHPAKLPMASTVLGRMLGPDEVNADYLWRNARDTVRFADAVKALAQIGPTHLVELSPLASLAANLRDIARFDGLPLEHFAPIPDLGTSARFDQIVARAWVQGLPIDHAALAGRIDGPIPALPAYPWDEQEHFTSLSPDGLDAWGEMSARRLVGHRSERAALVWMAEMTPSFPTWIADHRIGETIIVPAAALMEMALGAARELWPQSAVDLRDFDIVAPAIVLQDGIRIKTEVDAATGAVTLAQRQRLTEGDWSLIARGTIRRAQALPPAPLPPPRQMQSAEGIYAILAQRGLKYGPMFRRLAAVAPKARDVIWAEIAPRAHPEIFLLDPMALDGAFHAVAPMLQRAMPKMALAPDHALVPVRVAQMHLWQDGKEVRFAKLDLRKKRQHSVVVDVVLFDQDGQPIAQLMGLEFAAMPVKLPPRNEIQRSMRRFVRLRLPGQSVNLPKGWAGAIQKLGFGRHRPDANALSEALAHLRAVLRLDAGGVPQAIAKVLTIAPDLAHDIRGLLQAADGKTIRDGALHGVAAGLVRDATDEILDSLLRSWPKSERLNLLLQGFVDPILLAKLAADPRIDQIQVFHPDAECQALLPLVLPKPLQALITSAPQAGAFDVILDTTALQATDTALAPGGIRLGLDLPDLDSSRASQSDDLYMLRNGLTIRLTSQRKPKATTTADRADFRPMFLDGQEIPVTLRQQFTLETDAPTHHLLVWQVQSGDLGASIADLLARLRNWPLRSANAVPLLVICPEGQARGGAALALAAILRSLRNERPEAACGAILIDPLTGTENLPDWALLAEAALDHGIISVDGQRLETECFAPLDVALPQGHNLQLVQHRPSKIDSLTWTAAPARTLGKNDVEIAVEAVGLNFRDVMAARGLLPEHILDLGASGAKLGLECAGRVLRIGSNISDLTVGTRVMAFVSGAFATRVALPRAAVTRVPDNIDSAAAASIPVAFLTAWHALVDVARIRPNDSVLIHGAAGGGGLAAIQVALLHGAKVFATAGSAEKSAIARAYGAEAVFSSRDLSFAEALRAATGGRGVDVVLNALSGEAMQRSVECLAPFGRFIELGKRDYLEGTKLDLRPFQRNLSYHGLDLDQYFAANPTQVRQSMEMLAAAFAEGRLRPLPVTKFESTPDAFRYMLAARHIGKIVVTPPKTKPRRPQKPVRGNWVILGGTGGLGLEVAAALIKAGATHIHLVSRAGAPNIGSGPSGKWALTCDRVTCHAADAADVSALSAVQNKIEDSTGPIEGIIHSSMVLRDRMIADYDLAEALQVIRAKLGVAEALDQVLRSRTKQPRHVIFFSSIAATIGNIGQAAYNAANAAVEALAAKRRRDGLAAVSIGWGPVADAGYLARDAALAARIARQSGITLLSREGIIQELLGIIGAPSGQDYCLSAVTWEDLARHLPVLGQSPFRRLVMEGAGERRSATALAEDMKKLDWPAALSLAQQELGRALAEVLRMPAEQYEPDKMLSQFGIDSLMAMELRLMVEERFGCGLPPLTRDVTGARLAALLVAKIRGEDHDASQGNTDRPEGIGDTLANP